jgi:hypothetical protein
MDPRAAVPEYEEVFESDSVIEAQRIVDVILRPQGIDAVLHDRTSHAFPAPATMAGGVFVAVLSEQVRKARELISEACEAGYVSEESGELVGE